MQLSNFSAFLFCLKCYVSFHFSWARNLLVEKKAAFILPYSMQIEPDHSSVYVQVDPFCCISLSLFFNCLVLVLLYFTQLLQILFLGVRSYTFFLPTMNTMPRLRRGMRLEHTPKLRQKIISKDRFCPLTLGANEKYASISMNTTNFTFVDHTI